MASGINFSGLASGLDTDAIITQLTDIERRPVTLIQRRQATLEQQKSIIQGINVGLLSLKTKAESLADESLFSIVKVQSSDSDKLAATVTNEAAAGAFNVEVVKLAQARSLSTRSFASTSQALGLEGEFVVNGESLAVEADDSLIDLRDRINAADAGINAQILTVNTGDNRLIVTAEEVGADGFDLRDASASDLLQGLGFTSSMEDVKNRFANGARSSSFLSETETIASLLNLSAAPAGSFSIAGESITVDLTNDSLADVAGRIEAAGIAGVTAQVVSVDDGGLTRHHLEISGTTAILDNTGALETLGVLDSGGQIVDEIVAGAESDAFSSTTTALGSLLGLGNAPSGTVTVAGQALSFDLSEDSLTAIQTRINDAGIAGVTATVTTSANDDGTSQFRLRIAGTTDLTDSGNVLEALGVLEGSNSAFQSVARRLTGNTALQARGAILHNTGSGAASDELSSDVDPVGDLVGSTASGSVRVAGTQVAIDLSTDSLNAIRDKINAAGIAGVSAVVNVTGPSDFELQIDGTQDLDDANGVLQALGVLGAPTAMTANTKFADLAGGGVKAGDTISISGRNRAGDQVAGTFTVSSTNLKVDNLLTTVRQLFGNGATASVDATGRIVLSDDQAGASELSLTLTANNEGGGNLSFGTLAVTTQGADARSAELQAGQDAEVRINGITVRRSTNAISDAVEGVTLDLREVTDGETVEVTVTKDDTSQLRSQLEGFVAEFNSAMGLIDQQFAVDKTTGEGGPLVGDSTLIGLQSRLRQAVTGQISVDGEFNALVFMGITFDRQGRLTIDAERLDDALQNHLPEVQRLFVAEGTTSSDKVEFVRSSERTRAGQYAVQVTTAARRAEVVGTADLSGGLAEDQSLTISETGADNKVAVVQLRAGDDIDAIVAKINNAADSEVAEVRRASAANTTDGATAVSEATTFAQLFGAGVADGDTIRIQGTTHSGNAVVRQFVIDDTSSSTLGDLLQEVRSTFGNAISANVDDDGRIFVTDNQVGPSSLTVTLVEGNEGGGSLDLGSLEPEVEGRFPMEITAENRDGHLFLRHDAYGSRAGFSIAQSREQLGLEAQTHSGTDVVGTINGEAAEGQGRILTGSRDNDTTDGLVLRVTAADEDLAGGTDLGSVDLVYGIGRILNDTLSFITSTFDGTLKTRTDAIDDTIRNMDDQIDALNRRVEQTRKGLVSKFSILEGTLATLQSQGNFLSSQLAGLMQQAR